MTSSKTETNARTWVEAPKPTFFKEQTMDLHPSATWSLGVDLGSPRPLPHPFSSISSSLPPFLYESFWSTRQFSTRNPTAATLRWGSGMLHVPSFPSSQQTSIPWDLLSCCRIRVALLLIAFLFSRSFQAISRPLWLPINPQNKVSLLGTHNCMLSCEIQHHSLPGSPQPPHLTRIQSLLLTNLHTNCTLPRTHSCHIRLGPDWGNNNQRIKHPPNIGKTRLLY